MKQNKEKLIKQLFAGKVAEIISWKKTAELMEEATLVMNILED